MLSDIDELLEWLRGEETMRRKYKTDVKSIKRRATFEADCHARWIAAVEKLVAFRASYYPFGKGDDGDQTNR